MITLDDALASYAATLSALPAEIIATPMALGRVLAAPVSAAHDLPRFAQSAMDGYALRASETSTASAEAPCDLPVSLTVAARAWPESPVLRPGTAARIFTGAMLPTGADCVIPQERVQRHDGGRGSGQGDGHGGAFGTIRFIEPSRVGRNVRPVGEELFAGTPLAMRGQRIGPGLLASLINAGVDTVSVHRRPRVQVFVTGDEIRPAGSTLLPGEIHDSNGPLVAGVLRGWGCEAAAPVHLADNEGHVRDAVASALAEADLVLSTGGASVGDKDYLIRVAEQLGLRRIFWKVAQKPAKPLYFGVLERRHPSNTGDSTQPATLLALPGNPGAVLISLLLHVRTALDVLEGVTPAGPRWVSGVLETAVDRDAERTRLMRMSVAHDASGCARLTPLPHQDSHMLSNLGRAEVLVRVESGSGPVPVGSRLPWTPMPG